MKIEKLDHRKRSYFITMGQLTAGMAHELRNPMAIIQLAVEELSRVFLPTSNGISPKAKGEAKESLRVIEENIRRMSNIIEQIYRISHPRNDHNQRLNMHHILKTMKPTLDQLYKKKKVKFHLILEAKNSLFFGTREKIEQALYQLVSNAVEAFESGGKGSNITFKTASNGSDSFDLFCTDDGPGVEKEILPRIFEPFFTTKELGHGMGMGLFLVAETIRHNGGYCEANSGPQGGLEIRIRFPNDRRKRTRWPKVMKANFASKESLAV